ncbi:hypothetical protein EDD22DRAFT_1052859 [Suillus occidentalis]|nr:hypothetical protein EDD22DRAFT_1052859 [Suillus occidentalis]
MHYRISASSVAWSSSSSSPSDTSITTSDECKPLFLLDGVSGEECDRELDPAEYRLVKSWMKKQWLEQFPQNTSAVPGSSSMKSARGSKRMAQGINVSCTYLQDENGVPVLAQRARAIRTKMLSCFRQLHMQGLAPESIGQASLDVLKWLVHTLRKEYIELWLCADNWKTMRLMTDNYSQWYSYHVKNKGKRVKVEADDTCLEDESISDNSDKHVAKRPRIDSDTTPEITRDPSPNHLITRDPSPDRQTTTNHHLGLIKENRRRSLYWRSNLVIKPRPRPIPPKIIATSTDSSPSANTSTPNIIPSPSNDMTQLSLPEVQSSADAASLATKVELVAATPITIDSKNNIIKKRQPSTKPMRVSAKITARNLCAFNWQSNGHQKEPASAFATYWNGLSKANKEVYKCKATAQLKSSGIVGTVHDVDDE